MLLPQAQLGAEAREVRVKTVKREMRARGAEVDSLWPLETAMVAYERVTPWGVSGMASHGA